MKVSRTRRIVAASTGGALLLGMLSACAQSSPFTTVKDFLVAWQVENYEAAAGHTTGDPEAVVKALEGVRTQLDAASLRLRLRAESTPGMPDDEGRIEKFSDTRAQARFQIRIDLGENGRPLEYQGQMALQRIGGTWKVVWSPSVIHPDLREGERLAVVNESPQRQLIQDNKGRPLLEAVRTEVFGVVPERLRNLDTVVKRIGEITDQDRDRLKGRILSAPPKAFLQLAEFPQGSPEALKLRNVAGLEQQVKARPTRPLQAEELIGRIGPATTDVLSLVGAPYQPGDTVGTSGLQLLFQRRLAGLPSVKVVILGANGERRKEIRDFSDGEDLAGHDPTGLETAEARPVRTTLDRGIQFQAENALSSLGVPASLVTVRSETGEILAAANHGTDGQNRAFEGLYAPGTTFSTVLAAALIGRQGQKADTEQECTAEETVGGAVFTTTQPRTRSTLGLNIANGCRTALAQAGAGLDGATINAALQKFGLVGSAPWELSNVKNQRAQGLATGTTTERAQLAVGEGGVKVSPLTMALIAAAVQNGTWKGPLLIRDPQPTTSPAPQYIEPNTLTELQNIMVTGVRKGSAKAAASGRRKFQRGISAQATDTQGKTVSWFVGYYQSSGRALGIAIAIEGQVDAAKIASDFINAPARPPQEPAATPGVTAQP
ncbi:penicillin-binding transpeptidase domain-containing protein [Actinocorallia populi]|uniref:penicillin-binding transpeptidase domain-containing protein n=1 Tax=Actinocorallia populi TaxID=2079200 RepID=UPI000D08E1E5|nr:penicillin-binding transpeptidase domain-containing protein [Actinocorallia populi]